MTPLIEARFRANPDYELLLPDEAARRADAPLPVSPHGQTVYGYLSPRPESRLSWRTASPDTALLFLTLRRDGRVPAYFRAAFGERAENHLSRLVLDGVLEVEHDAAFVSGPGARTRLFGDGDYAGTGPLAARSIEALRYLDALGELSIPEMTRRLYGFGRQPVTAAQKRTFNQAGLDAFSGFGARGPVALERYWLLASTANPHWVMWRPSRNGDADGSARFKLYVSPRLAQVAEAFAATADILGQGSGVTGLKLGRGLAGLTRPDKLVAYFARLEDLQAAGASLCRRLEGCPAHGVPFTAALSPDGLLSWGADRPGRAPGRLESWRLWIASRLAAHFETARRSGAPGPHWRTVIDLLRLDGVNTDTWAPGSEFWLSLASEP